MDDSNEETEENNNLFDIKEKEIASKTHSQNKQNKIHAGGLNLNENATSGSLSSCSQSKKYDCEFMIECSTFRAWIHYQYTELPLYMMASLINCRRKYSCTYYIYINETLEKYTKAFKKYKPGENEP